MKHILTLNGVFFSDKYNLTINELKLFYGIDTYGNHNYEIILYDKQNDYKKQITGTALVCITVKDIMNSTNNPKIELTILDTIYKMCLEELKKYGYSKLELEDRLQSLDAMTAWQRYHKQNLTRR